MSSQITVFGAGSSLKENKREWRAAQAEKEAP